jgi:DNA-binding SARP family transcriptional activator/tetratricopeptide (TPR) repeat protein
MEFRILGELEVLANGHAVDLAGQKQRALLALLLLEANRSVSRDRLIDALWEDEPTPTASKALQVYVSQLRKLLGKERLVTQPSGYLLWAGPDELDLDRFRRLQAEGKPHDALALWRGPPLAEFAQMRFARAEIARLEELHLSCWEKRLEADLAAGRHAEIAGELEGLVQANPLRERLRELQLLSLYRSGRQAEALAAYQDARRVLVDELGIEPGKALRELQQAILRQDPWLEPAPARDAEPARGGVFVGREPELAQLLDGLEDAIAGHGRLFLLVGEPGIGKSRLAEEAIRRARGRGVQVLVGRCWEASGAPAYWPWVQSLRSYIRDAEPEALQRELGSGGAEVAQILPELRVMLPGLADAAPLDAESARFRLFDATAEFLRNVSGDRPLLLFLDDLHAADEPSLLLLQFLARELASARMLVIGACRDVDPIPGRPLAAMLSEVAREPVTTRLSLGGLSERDVGEYVELTAAELALPELVAALHEETDGNPLFVGETVRLLVIEGRIAIPQSVRDVIARRLSHLGEECNRVLLLASVLGREFALAALAQMSGLGEDELLDALDEAMAARVVSDAPGVPGGLRFAHVLIRDTLYEGVTTARRVRLHRLAVEALESLYGEESGPHLAELAHHAIAGSDFEKAVVRAQQAADRALALLAFEEAARLYRTALDSLELARPGDERTRCELLLSLGEAEIRGGNSAVAKEAFREAAGIARRLGLSRELARAAAGYGGRIVFARAGDDAALVPLLEEALAAIGEEDVELRARILARLAGALRDEPLRDRRDTLSREAVELARSTGNDAALAYALDGRAAVITGPDTIAECFALGRELCEVAARIGDPERIGYGYMHRFFARLQDGDIGGAEDDLTAARRVAEELRQAPHLWQVVGAQAMLALAIGELADGAELSARALEIGERAVPFLAIPVYHLQRYTLCDFRGSVAESERPIRQLVADYPARPVFRCALAHLHVRLGRPAEAKAILDDLSEDDFAALPFEMEWLFGASLLAETSATLGDVGSASVLYRLLAPWAALTAADMVEGIRGSVSRYLGLLATTLESWEEAAARFEDALATNERMGFRPWLARTQEDFARMLRLRAEPGDEARADELEAAALAAYDELGMSSSGAAPA